LFYVDEFGFRLNMTRNYARAPQGERANAASPSDAALPSRW
jgi:hypothetical protein